MGDSGEVASRRKHEDVQSSMKLPCCPICGAPGRFAGLSQDRGPVKRYYRCIQCDVEFVAGRGECGSVGNRGDRRRSAAPGRSRR